MLIPGSPVEFRGNDGPDTIPLGLGWRRSMNVSGQPSGVSHGSPFAGQPARGDVATVFYCCSSGSRQVSGSSKSERVREQRRNKPGETSLPVH